MNNIKDNNFPKSSLKNLMYIALAICFISAGGKGWTSVLLIPSLFLVVPTLLIANNTAWRIEQKTSSWFIRNLRKIQLLLTVLAYISFVGLDDNPGVLVFGFFRVDTNAPIAQINGYASKILYLTAIMAFLALIASMLYIRFAKKGLASVAKNTNLDKLLPYVLVLLILAFVTFGVLYNAAQVRTTSQQTDTLSGISKEDNKAIDQAFLDRNQDDKEVLSMWRTTMMQLEGSSDSLSVRGIYNPSKSKKFYYIAHKDTSGLWSIIYQGNSNKTDKQTGEKYNLPTAWYE